MLLAIAAGFAGGAKYANTKWEAKDAKRVQAQATADFKRREILYEADAKASAGRRAAVDSIRTGDGVRDILAVIERNTAAACLPAGDSTPDQGKSGEDQPNHAARTIEAARGETEKLAVACAVALEQANEVWLNIRSVNSD